MLIVLRYYRGYILFLSLSPPIYPPPCSQQRGFPIEITFFHHHHFFPFASSSSSNFYHVYPSLFSWTLPHELLQKDSLSDGVSRDEIGRFFISYDLFIYLYIFLFFSLFESSTNSLCELEAQDEHV